jgi:hypothetical protein
MIMYTSTAVLDASCPGGCDEDSNSRWSRGKSWRLKWRALQELGEVEVFDRTLESDIVARASDADILLTTRTAISAATITQTQAFTLYRRGVHPLRPNRPEGGARS